MHHVGKEEWTDGQKPQVPCVPSQAVSTIPTGSYREPADRCASLGSYSVKTEPLMVSHGTIIPPTTHADI